MADMRQSEKNYDNFHRARFRERNSKKITSANAGENFYGMCPVASPKTVCCDLKTIDAVECDAVVIGTPIDLGKVVKLSKPSVRVQYKLQEIGEPTLEDVLKSF